MAAAAGGGSRLAWLVAALALALVLAGPGAGAARARGADKQNSLRRAASGVYQGVSGLVGEDNVRALQKFFSRLTERFVYGVDVLGDTFWRIWTDLLDVLGIDEHSEYSPGPSTCKGRSPVIQGMRWIRQDPNLQLDPLFQPSSSCQQPYPCPAAGWCHFTCLLVFVSLRWILLLSLAYAVWSLLLDRESCSVRPVVCVHSPEVRR